MKRAAAKRERQAHVRAFHQTFAPYSAEPPAAPSPPPKVGERPIGVRMTEAHIDRIVEFVDDLFLGLQCGQPFPEGVEIIECPDGCLWVVFREKQGRLPVVELHLRNRLRASITVATLGGIIEKLSWANACAEVDRFEYNPDGHEPISKDYLRVLLDYLTDARKTLNSATDGLLDAEIMLPRHDVESGICFTIPLDVVAA